MAFLDKYLFQVNPAPTRENESKIEWRGFLDDIEEEIVIWDDFTNSELFRIGSGGAGVAWILDGNTEGAERTLGTNDAFDLPIITNGVERMRIMASNGSIGIGTAGPDASAILEIASTDQGLLVPRMTTLQRNAIGAPATSLLIYNTGTNLFNYWDGAAWQELDSNATSEWLLDGNTNGALKYFGTNDAFDLPFYTNGLERMRILAANGYTGFNTAAAAAMVHIVGENDLAGNVSLRVDNFSGSNLMRISNTGVISSSVSPSGWYLPSFVTGELTSGQLLNSADWNNIGGGDLFNGNPQGVKILYGALSYGVLSAFEIQNISVLNTYGSLLLMKTGGNVGIGLTTPTAKLHARGVDNTVANYAGIFEDSAAGPILTVNNAGLVGVNIALATMPFDVRSAFQNIANFKSTAVGTIGTVYVDGDAGSQVHYYDAGVYKAGFGWNAVTSFWHTNGDYIGISVNNGGGYPFIMKPTGVINLPNLQVGNAGLVAGDTYKDSAANITAAGDFFVAVKA